MSFEEIDYLIRLAQQPIGDEWLDGLADSYHIANDPYYRFLYHLVKYMQPPLCLEIGVEFGIASAHMAAAAEAHGGHVIGIDINSHKMMTKVIPERFGNYTFLHGSSIDSETLAQVCQLIATYGDLGIVYQDSSHHYAPSIQEWRLYSPFVYPGGVWICDDITPAFHDPNIDPPDRGMVQYFQDRPGNKRLYPDVLHRGNTQGVILL